MNITHMYTHIYFVIIIEYINTFPIYLISASYKISDKQTNIKLDRIPCIHGTVLWAPQASALGL